jgi:tetratricopeptide (TPR) repeat protein
MAQAFPWARVGLDRPILVIAAKDEQSMRRMAPGYWEVRNGTRPGAVFVTGRDRHYVTLRADIEVSEQNVNPYSTAFWSYSALVLDNSFPRDLPLWLSNGLSSMLSNTIIMQNEVQFGRPIPWLVERVNTPGGRVKFADLVAMTRDTPYFRAEDTRRDFDAQSWGLVQYMMFGARDRGAKLNDVVARLIKGTPSQTAIEEVYGSLEKLDTAARLYLGQRLFTYMRLLVESDMSATKMPVRTLTEAESAASRAAFHVAMNRPVEARALIAEARKANPSLAATDDAEAILFEREQRMPEAQAAYGRATDAGSTNFWSYYRQTTIAPAQGLDAAALKAAADRLERATVLNPYYPFAFSQLAAVRSRLGEHEKAIDAAVKAVGLQPADVWSRITAAQSLGQLSRQTEGLVVAREALRLAATDQERAAAQAAVKALGGGSPQPAYLTR